MNEDIMKYLHFNTKLPERKITNYLMNKVRALARAGKWNWRTTGIISDRDRKEEVKVKTIIFDYCGKRMLAVFLFFNRLHTYDWDDNAGRIGVNESTVYLFSDDYVYVSRKVPVSVLWNMKITPDKALFKDLLRYDEVNPRAGLKCYVEKCIQLRDTKAACEPQQLNFLLLLFAQYNKGLELLVKANLFHIAEYLIFCAQDKDTILNDPAESFHNLKEWLGLTNRVLKTLNHMLSTRWGFAELEDKGWWFVTNCSVIPRKPLTDREFFARLSDIQNYNPEYLNMESYTPSVLQLFMENHLIHSRPVNVVYPIRRRITGISVMDDKHILTIIRFLKTLDEYETMLYMSYLHECGKCVDAENYPYGLCPKDLKEAEEIAKYELTGYKDLEKKTATAFCRRARSKDYRYYTTDKNAEIKKGNRYFVSAPNNPADLYKEAQSLGHCAYSYCHKIAYGETRILFLRRVENPQKPFVTLEVSLDDCLIQAKALQNSQAPMSAQEYLLEWAKEKGIQLDTDDIEV